MKKILLSLLILLSTNFIYAGGPLQWRVGLMALPHNMWLLSTGFIDVNGTTKTTYTPQFTFNTNLGFVAGVNFTDIIGVEVNVLLGKTKQDMNYNVKNEITGKDSIDVDYSIEITKTDIPVLLKIGGLMYFEVGPQFTMISKVEEISDAGTKDATDYYSSAQMFGIIGTGVGIDVPKIARIEAGLRLGYGFQDLNAHEAEGVFIRYNDAALYQAFWGIKLAAIHKF